METDSHHLGDDALRRIDLALEGAGLTRESPLTEVKKWGRSSVHTTHVQDGILWLKHGYRLPPGEERVVERLARRHRSRLPEIVATWDGGFAMRPMEGVELDPDHELQSWVEAAEELGALLQSEIEHVDEWLQLGVRDRRPHDGSNRDGIHAKWRATLDALRQSPVVAALGDDRLAQLDQLLPDWKQRYEDAFEYPATLVPQDSGCCNIHVTTEGPIFFDWADVVVGHPVFSCDRLLDQVPRDRQAAVISAFCAPLQLSEEEFRAMRRSNVLHEVVRYHDELDYVPAIDPIRDSLENSVRSQLCVLIDHELSS